MAERKTDAEKLQELEKKMAQLQAQKKAIEARTKDKERKARTRRLIEIGALSEKYFNCANIEPSEFENLLKRLVYIEQVKSLLPKDEEPKEQEQNHQTTEQQ